MPCKKKAQEWILRDMPKRIERQYSKLKDEKYLHKNLIKSNLCGDIFIVARDLNRDRMDKVISAAVASSGIGFRLNISGKEISIIRCFYKTDKPAADDPARLHVRFQSSRKEFRAPEAESCKDCLSQSVYSREQSQRLF